MVHYYLFSHPSAVDMCINLCRSDAFMPQHSLYHTEVRTSFEKVCGKGVAEGMRADVFGQADSFGQDFDDVEDHDAGNVLSFPANENKVFVAAMDFHRMAVNEIEL